VKSIIRGGTVVDETGTRVADVLIDDGVIVSVGLDLQAEDATVLDATVLDATGCVVSPGLVDVHVHLREPGKEESETIDSGARAAALGGCTAILAMPNTIPRIDSSGVVRQVQKLAQGKACDVFPAGAITIGQEGNELTPMSELKALGVTFFTDDGEGVQSAGVMRRALEYSTMLDVVIADHCEVESLTHAAHMHEGEVSTVLGIGGMPTEAEEFMVARDIALARKTGARLHLMHISTKNSLEMVRKAKAEGLKVTAEATPHHFSLTDEELRSFNANFKVNPPLRSQDHVDALKEAIYDGTIDVIATDHAPWTPHFKDMPIDKASFGMLGLETSLAVAITNLDLPIERILALMSWQPARLAQLAEHGLPIAAGNPANITVIDTEHTWVVEPERLASQSRNTPFAGRKLKGKVRHTLLRGEPTVLNGEAQK
jgi:dihydroorotase